ncbi:unnamed protein product [Amoebophrya sp. A25]|nr:unnamed protein product [Amoebophrya sp. A25]|eukprot:GSA25T00007092001.1
MKTSLFFHIFNRPLIEHLLRCDCHWYGCRFDLLCVCQQAEDVSASVISVKRRRPMRSE